MSRDLLTVEARRENAAALASALGISLDEAAHALDLRIAVTADPRDAVACAVAEEVISLLSRTVQDVSSEVADAVITAELIIGCTAPRTSALPVYLAIDADQFSISRERHATQTSARIPALFRLLSACYASGVTLYHALGGSLPFTIPDPLTVEFRQLGVNLADLKHPIDIGRTYLAGAGAIGNGFLWAARHLQLRGQLDVVDDDDVSSGNLNRQIWFDKTDITLPKTERLVAHAQPHFPHLTLKPRTSRLQGLPERSDGGSWLRRLIVAVDSRRARRALQNEFPHEVFDASTTDIREVVLHHQVQPTQNACMSCIYEPDAEESTREQHIADHLGVTLEDVRSERVSPAAAATIAERYPQLAQRELVGIAYDTLFKNLCAEGELKTLEGKRVIAPFAFVSVLAGTMLALELVRRLSAGAISHDDNYWRISPWHPPLARRRILRPRQPGCLFCADPLLSKANRSLWG